MRLGIILGAALLFKGAYLWSYWRNNPFATFLVGDAAIYADWARTINAEGWLGGEVFYRAPLYPYLLGLVYRVLGDGTLGVYLLQLLMGLGVLALVYLTAVRVFGQRAGWAAAVFCLGYAPFTFAETKLLPMVTQMLLGMSSVWLLVRAERESSARLWIAGATVLGLAILCRPNYALAVPVLILLLLLRGRRSLAKVVPQLVIVALIPALLIGLVAVRNYAVAGDLVLISANGGVTFAQGNNLRARGSMAVLDGFSGSPDRQQQEETAIAERALGRGLKPSEVNRYWFGRGFAFIRDDPAAYLRLTADKARLLVNNREFGSNYLLQVDRTLSPVLYLAFVPFGLMLGFGLVGLYRIVRERLPATSLVAVAAGAVLMMLLFYVNTRYRMTLAPAAAVLAGGGVDLVVREVGNRKRVAILLGVVALAGVLSLPPSLPFDEDEILRGDADYWSNLGVAWIDRGRLDEAIAAYERAIELSPRTYRHYAEKTKLLQAAGTDPRTLAGWVDHVARSFPDRANAQMAHAEMMRALGRHDEAIRAYHRVLELSPDALVAYRRLGALYLATGETERAMAVLEEGLRRFPDDGELLNIHERLRAAPRR